MNRLKNSHAINATDFISRIGLKRQIACDNWTKFLLQTFKALMLIFLRILGLEILFTVQTL